jgi:hypothetical protein
MRVLQAKKFRADFSIFGLLKRNMSIISKKPDKIQVLKQATMQWPGYEWQSRHQQYATSLSLAIPKMKTPAC